VHQSCDTSHHFIGAGLKLLNFVPPVYGLQLERLANADYDERPA
jgi:hypothetical protein